MGNERMINYKYIIGIKKDLLIIIAKLYFNENFNYNIYIISEDVTFMKNSKLT